MWESIVWLALVILAGIFFIWVVTHTAEIGKLLDLGLQRATENLEGKTNGSKN